MALMVRGVSHRLCWLPGLLFSQSPEKRAKVHKEDLLAAVIRGGTHHLGEPLLAFLGFVRNAAAMAGTTGAWFPQANKAPASRPTGIR